MKSLFGVSEGNLSSSISTLTALHSMRSQANIDMYTLDASVHGSVNAPVYMQCNKQTAQQRLHFSHVVLVQCSFEILTGFYFLSNGFFFSFLFTSFNILKIHKRSFLMTSHMIKQRVVGEKNVETAIIPCKLFFVLRNLHCSSSHLKLKTFFYDILICVSFSGTTIQNLVMFFPPKFIQSHSQQWKCPKPLHFVSIFAFL